MNFVFGGALILVAIGGFAYLFPEKVKALIDKFRK